MGYPAAYRRSAVAYEGTRPAPPASSQRRPTGRVVDFSSGRTITFRDSPMPKVPKAAFKPEAPDPRQLLRAASTAARVARFLTAPTPAGLLRLGVEELAKAILSGDLKISPLISQPAPASTPVQEPATTTVEEVDPYMDPETTGYERVGYCRSGYSPTHMRILPSGGVSSTSTQDANSCLPGQAFSENQPGSWYEIPRYRPGNSVNNFLTGAERLYFGQPRITVVGYWHRPTSWAGTPSHWTTSVTTVTPGNATPAPVSPSLPLPIFQPIGAPAAAPGLGLSPAQLRRLHDRLRLPEGYRGGNRDPLRSVSPPSYAPPFVREITIPSRGRPQEVTRPGTSGPRRPPRAGEREKKVQFKGALGKLWKGFATLTEVNDFVNAIYDAIPAKYRNGEKGLYAKALAIYRNARHLDASQAVANVVLNQIEDAIVGRISAKGGQGLEKLIGRRSLGIV